MQQSVPRHRPINDQSSQVQSIIITAITLFAVSGLLIGFVVGVFARPVAKQSPTIQPKNTPPIMNQQMPSPTVTPANQMTALGWPVIKSISYTLIADGTTVYTFAAHPVDQSIDKGHGVQVNAANITCKIWLTKDNNVDNVNNALKGIARDRLSKIDTLTQPMPNEVTTALIFDGAQQTQTCNATGETTWTFKVAPTTAPGDYSMIVLTDWLGQRYNWYTSFVTVKQPK